MIYEVKARFIEDKLKEFYERLTDGSISSQEPDGKSQVSDFALVTTGDT